MEEKGFHQFLKRAGKKEHVVQGLVDLVRDFEVYLVAERHTVLEAAGEQHILDYVSTLPQAEIKARLRALALYYKFLGNDALAKLVSDLREQRIAKPARLSSFASFAA